MFARDFRVRKTWKFRKGHWAVKQRRGPLAKIENPRRPDRRVTGGGLPKFPLSGGGDPWQRLCPGHGGARFRREDATPSSGDGGGHLLGRSLDTGASASASWPFSERSPRISRSSRACLDICIAGTARRIERAQSHRRTEIEPDIALNLVTRLSHSKSHVHGFRTPAVKL